MTDPPVVAVLDTGLGQHPWFPDEAEGATAESCTGVCPGAHRRVTVDGQPIGVWKEPSRDPENTGVVIDDVNGLVDVLCGHGTFISGVIRQRCPEAVILEVPIMASDGAALEDDVVTALSLPARPAPGGQGRSGHHHPRRARRRQPLARLLPRDPGRGRRHRPARPAPGVRRRGRGRRRLRRQRRHPRPLLPGSLRRPGARGPGRGRRHQPRRPQHRALLERRRLGHRPRPRRRHRQHRADHPLRLAQPDAQRRAASARGRGRASTSTTSAPGSPSGAARPSPRRGSSARSPRRSSAGRRGPVGSPGRARERGQPPARSSRGPTPSGSARGGRG